MLGDAGDIFFRRLAGGSGVSSSASAVRSTTIGRWTSSTGGSGMPGRFVAMSAVHRRHIAISTRQNRSRILHSSSLSTTRMRPLAYDGFGHDDRMGYGMEVDRTYADQGLSQAHIVCH